MIRSSCQFEQRPEQAITVYNVLKYRIWNKIRKININDISDFKKTVKWGFSSLKVWYSSIACFQLYRWGKVTKFFLICEEGWVFLRSKQTLCKIAFMWWAWNLEGDLSSQLLYTMLKSPPNIALLVEYLWQDKWLISFNSCFLFWETLYL